MKKYSITSSKSIERLMSNTESHIGFTRVSVVIPCFNEEEYIERCVNSLLNATRDKIKLVVRVCDGFSTDRTREIVKSIVTEKTDVKLLDNPQKTAPHALNIGIEDSLNEDVIIILGAHSEVDVNFLVSNVKALEEHPEAGCVGGVLENVYLNETALIIGKAMSSPFGVGNAHFRTGTKEGYVDTVAFGAYRKDVFEKIGLFDLELTRNQDDEFNFRLLKHTSYEIYLSSEIRCKYYVRGSFSKLKKQYYQYGYWKVFVNKKHKEITTLRQMVPSLFVLGFLALPITFFVPYLFLINVSAVLLYFVLALFFSFKAGKGKFVLKIFGAFLTLHLSYGIGYLLGILDFLFLNRKAVDKRATEVSR